MLDAMALGRRRNLSEHVSTFDLLGNPVARLALVRRFVSVHTVYPGSHPRIVYRATAAVQLILRHPLPALRSLRPVCQ